MKKLVFVLISLLIFVNSQLALSANAADKYNDSGKDEAYEALMSQLKEQVDNADPLPRGASSSESYKAEKAHRAKRLDLKKLLAQDLRSDQESRQRGREILRRQGIEVRGGFSVYEVNLSKSNVNKIIKAMGPFQQLLNILRVLESEGPKTLLTKSYNEGAELEEYLQSDEKSREHTAELLEKVRKIEDSLKKAKALLVQKTKKLRANGLSLKSKAQYNTLGFLTSYLSRLKQGLMDSLPRKAQAVGKKKNTGNGHRKKKNRRKKNSRGKGC